MNSPSVSIVIPTKNAGPDFDQVLPILFEQEIESAPEILVVDSGSSDETEEICRRYSVRFERIPADTFGHGRTRNLGVSRTQGELVCLLTQDALPVDAKFLRNLIEPFSRQDVAGVVGRQIPKPGASVLTVRDVSRWVLGGPDARVSKINSQNEFEALSPLEQYRMSAFDNVCSAIRRSVWERVPFPDVVFGEDIEWGYRVLRCGYSIAYEPRAAVYHSHNRPLQYRFRRTIADHYRLSELFGLETIPTLFHIPGSILRQIVGDIRDLVRAQAPVSVRLRELMGAPAQVVVSVLGQYLGSRAYRRGRPADEVASV